MVRRLLLLAAVGLAELLGCSKPEGPPTPLEVLAGLEARAEAGDAQAQFELGWTLDKGDGVPMDVGAALDWLRKAAAQGQPEAAWRLGQMYFHGDGVPQDGDKAALALKPLAERQDPRVVEFLRLNKEASEGYALLYGRGVPRDRERGRSLLEGSAASGSALAQYLLGMELVSGEALSRDVVKGMQWVEKSAEQGFGPARFLAGTRYMEGKVVSIDRGKGVRYLSAGATRGDPACQMNLAVTFCAAGDDIFRSLAKDEAQSHLDGLRLCDPVLGLAWLLLAADGGNELALRYRDESIRRVNSYREFGLVTGGVEEARALAASWKPGVLLKRRGAQSRGGVPGRASSGTGFFVSSEGHVVTNHHVVDGCTEVRLQGDGRKVEVVVSDKANDLALLKATGGVPAVAVLSPTAGVKQGEDVVVFGYPLGSILSAGGNLTPGVVSALSGFENNAGQIQITAPIQPGSSGSAVLNRKGHLVGVVAASLTRSGDASGAVPQNANFAVNGQTLRGFLDASKVPYVTGSRFFDWSQSNEEAAEAARRWTVIVECWE